MAQIGSLSVKLGLVTVDWDKATTKAKAQAKDLQDSFSKLGGGVKTLVEHFKNFGALGGAIGLAALYQETKTLTDEVDDLSKSYGLSISQILAFRGALRDAGGQSDAASKAISTLFSKVDDAKQGNDTAIAQFQKLGITFGELKTLSPYEAISRVADGFKNISDQFEKTKAIKEFFGKGGIGLTMSDVADALAQSTTKFDEYAASIKIVGQVSDSVKANMENLKIAFAEVIAPFTSAKVLTIKEFELILRGLGSAALVIGIGAVAGQIVAVAAAIRAATVAGAAFNIMAGGMTPVGIILKAVGVAGAIGAFLYASSASSPAPAGGGVPSTAYDESGASIMNASQKPYEAPKTYAPIVGATTEQAAAARTAFAASDPRLTTNVAAISKEATIKQFSLALSQQLMAVDSARAAINVDIENKDALTNQLALIRLGTKEKTLQIDAKLAQELQGMKETGSQELKDATASLAMADKKRVTQQGAADEAIAREKYRLEMKKKAFDAEAEYLRTTAASGADNEQTTAAQRQEEEDARTRAAHAFGNQAREAERLGTLANERLAFEGKIAALVPAQQAAALAKYDLEAGILDFQRQAIMLGWSDARIKAYTDSARELGAATAGIVKTNEDAQRTFEFGWTKAFNTYKDAATNAAVTGADVFGVFSKSMSDAIDKFVDTGKLSFSSLSESIIKDLLKIQLKKQAMDLLDIGKSSGSNMMAAGFGMVKSLFGFADGGTPPVNQVSIVGERGPELFVPKTLGTVLPNDFMSKASGAPAPSGSFAQMASNAPTVNYNGPYIESMSAIDTQSGLQFLAKNKQSVWSAYQSANRSIPMSR